MESVLKKKRKEDYDGKDWQIRKALSLEWKSGEVTDDESGESMEPMGEVPLVGLGVIYSQRDAAENRPVYEEFVR